MYCKAKKLIKLNLPTKTSTFNEFKLQRFAGKKTGKLNRTSAERN